MPAGGLPCSVQGSWELALVGAGCPVPAQIVLKDGAADSPNEGAIPAIRWTLAARTDPAGACTYTLEDQAGRLFRVAGDITGQGAALSGDEALYRKQGS